MTLERKHYPLAIIGVVAGMLLYDVIKEGIVSVYNDITKEETASLPEQRTYAILYTKVALEYKDATKDTFDIVVSYSERGLLLNQGDLIYWRGHENTPNAGKTTLASYVKSYKVIKEEAKHIPY